MTQMLVGSPYLWSYVSLSPPLSSSLARSHPHSLPALLSLNSYKVLEDADEVGLGFEADTGQSAEDDDNEGPPEGSDVEADEGGAVASKDTAEGGEGDVEGAEPRNDDDGGLPLDMFSWSCPVLRCKRYL